MTLFIVYALGIFVLVLPFFPAIREVMRPSDSKALKITDHILRDPRSGPDFIFWHFAQLVGADSLESMGEIAKVTDPTLLNDAVYLVPEGPLAALPKNAGRVLAARSIELKNKTNYMSKILSLRSVQTGEENAINEIHAREKLTIKARSKVMWWASAETMSLGDQLDLPGKIQATESIEVDSRISFHHLEAKVIRTKNFTQSSNPLANTFVALPLKDKRNHYNENCDIRAGETIEGDLIVRGNLIVHENARVEGSIKGHQQITLMPGASVTGNVVAHGNIECRGNNWIGGTVLGQKNVRFQNGTYVGSENQRITVSADTIQIEGAFQAHGTLRAWKRGTFEG